MISSPPLSLPSFLLRLLFLFLIFHRTWIANPVVPPAISLVFFWQTNMLFLYLRQMTVRLPKGGPERRSSLWSSPGNVVCGGDGVGFTVYK
uniref:Uncharacterized protein n=1 Tax=Anopheles darlingi TaxID=43151 RepID=A0A2M4DA98_ANODA